MSRLIVILILPLLVLVTGCGSSAADNVRSAVSNMRNVIQTYNSSHPNSLSATAAACRKAYDDMGKSSALSTERLSGSHRAEQTLLRSALESARRGFHGCAVGASSLDFPAVVAAEQQIASANAAIARARKLER